MGDSESVSETGKAKLPLPFKKHQYFLSLIRNAMIVPMQSHLVKIQSSGNASTLGKSTLE